MYQLYKYRSNKYRDEPGKRGRSYPNTNLIIPARALPFVQQRTHLTEFRRTYG